MFGRRSFSGEWELVVYGLIFSGKVVIDEIGALLCGMLMSTKEDDRNKKKDIGRVRSLKMYNEQEKNKLGIGKMNIPILQGIGKADIPILQELSAEMHIASQIYCRFIQMFESVHGGSGTILSSSTLENLSQTRTCL
ncbi:hypothetical protein Tco_1359977 [Tanacetum coccineum]